MNRFLDLADFSRDEVKDLLGLAARLQRQPDPHALAGKVLGLLFMNPSLRTLASFQSGMMRLGGSVYVVTPGQGTWQMETRTGAIMNGSAAEHVKESVPVLASYCDAIGIRMFAENKNLAADLAETQFKMMADLCKKPLVNMESAINHPCQALADWYTMDELKVPERGKFVLSWANHPRALPLAVPAATVHMAAQRGMEVVVLRPDGFALPDQIMDKARAAAKASGGTVTESTDRAEALKGAHVLYAKEWGAPQHYGDNEAESRVREYLGDWCVKDSWFKSTDPNCHFMHCLPVRRNVAVDDEVLDGPHSVVIQEAFNRMVVQMAILYRLLRN
ncbi:MAG TPA: N-acetylornithine carbamoyltransferase [Steroidobacteraceae bacterium]|nr:N-acetylornithine carbamoyltransferase [Steroidobacteraceae bacterium]